MSKQITITSEQFADKQARNLTNAAEDIKRGVESVTTCPSHLTDAQLQKMQLNFTAAMNSGKTKSRMHAVLLDDWKKNTIEIGIGRIPQGIAKARNKVIAFANELLPYEQSGLSKINAMPNITLEDSINRMTAWTRHMANFKRKS